eukprot:3497098-Pleurochrysis_carterae.AAC.2
MKIYIAGELRKMLTAFTAMGAATGRALFTPQQVVQVDYFAPTTTGATSAAQASASTNPAFTGIGVAGAV